MKRPSLLIAAISLSYVALAYSVVTTAIFIAEKSSDVAIFEFVGIFIGAITTIFLSHNLYHGKNWARICMIALSCLFIIGHISSSIFDFYQDDYEKIFGHVGAFIDLLVLNFLESKAVKSWTGLIQSKPPTDTRA